MSTVPRRAARRRTTLGDELAQDPAALAWVGLGLAVLAAGTSAAFTFGVVFLDRSWWLHGREGLVAAICVGAWLAAGARPRTSALVALGATWVHLLFALLRNGPTFGPILVMATLPVAAGFVLGARQALGLGVATALAMPVGLIGHASLAGEPWWVDLLAGGNWFVPAESVTLGLGALTYAGLRSYHRALGASELALRLQRAAFDQSPDGVIEVDHDGRVLHANPAAVALFGAALDGRTLAEASRDVGLADGLPLRSQPATLYTLPGAGGDARTWEVTVQELAQVEPVHALVVVRDVSERRALEDRLHHVERVEVVGQLAGGVAHDFNNLLTAVGGSAHVLRAHPDPEVREIAEELEGVQARGKALTGPLLAFARRDTPQAEALALGPVVEALRRMLGRLVKPEHKIVIRDLGPAHAVLDRGQLEQVVVNLVTNARDAMPEGGTITITTRGLGHAEAARLGSTLGPIPQVVLEVRDAGVGMSDETRARLFEAFFTTKPRGKGTGLGLATVRRVVDAGRGCVRVDSALGAGSTFRCFFPACTSAVAAPDADEVRPAAG